jgi:hypothetical protein
LGVFVEKLKVKNLNEVVDIIFGKWIWPKLAETVRVATVFRHVLVVVFLAVALVREAVRRASFLLYTCRQVSLRLNYPQGWSFLQCKQPEK